MKILLLCNKSPWPPKEGGPMAMQMMVEGLIREGHQVKILAVNSFKYDIRAEDIPDDYREQTGIELIDVDLRVRPFPAFMNLFTGRSYHVERFISEAFGNRLRRLLQEQTFDIIQLETLFVTPYLPILRKYSTAPVLLRSHNIEHQIWERLASTTSQPAKRWYLHHLATTLRRYEEEILHQVDGVIAITGTDEAYLSRHTSSPVITIPFGIDLNRYPVPDQPGEPLKIYTIGAMNWIPNADGVRWFLHHVWPTVHKASPDVPYHLAGREMPSWMTSLRIPGVVVEGEVPDARRFALSHGIMVVPLFSGSGIRVKIIEGMAAGRAIVSTPVGAEGIDYTPGKEILLATTACDFTDMLLGCIREPSVRHSLGSAARILAETHYNAPELIRRLIAFYTRCSR